MLVIIGVVIVLFSVIGGFLMEGGHFGVLFQPIELLIIGGAAAGSLIISSPMSLLKQIVAQLMGTMKSKEKSKEEYLEVLLLMFELCKTAKTNPLALEPHIENPETSDIFKRYPKVLADHHAVHFLADTLKVQISSPMSPYDLDDLMEAEIKAAHEEEHRAPSTIQRMGDAMPGLGIVAAVLGVVITMGKLSQGKEVIGHSVAAALVGTFLGILLCYGFFQPLAAKMLDNIEAGHGPIRVIKACLIALSKDLSPKVCVEFGRRTVPPLVRPSFEDVDKASSNIKKAA